MSIELDNLNKAINMAPNLGTSSDHKPGTCIDGFAAVDQLYEAKN
jgi:hypothetical protein